MLTKIEYYHYMQVFIHEKTIFVKRFIYLFTRNFNIIFEKIHLNFFHDFYNINYFMLIKIFFLIVS